MQFTAETEHIESVFQSNDSVSYLLLDPTVHGISISMNDKSHEAVGPPRRPLILNQSTAEASRLEDLIRSFNSYCTRNAKQEIGPEAASSLYVKANSESMCERWLASPEEEMHSRYQFRYFKSDGENKLGLFITTLITSPGEQGSTTSTSLCLRQTPTDNLIRGLNYFENTYVSPGAIATLRLGIQNKQLKQMGLYNGRNFIDNPEIPARGENQIDALTENSEQMRIFYRIGGLSDPKPTSRNFN